MKRLFFLINVFPLFLSFDAYGSDSSSIKILFIGNSLTYTNNLPALVKEIGTYESVNIHFTSFSFPNYSLEDHWNEGDIQKEIQEGKYDFVVAQQGPSAMPDSRLLLIEFSKKISALCKKNNTGFCLFTVWSSQARSFDYDDVITSYKKAAEETSAMLAPAGLVWKEAWKRDDHLSLYGLDGFHPSVAGSLLAAMTVYATVKKKKNFDFLHSANSSWKNDVTTRQLEIFKLSVKKVLTVPL